MACADTGSEENIISADLARAIGFVIQEPTSEKRQFMLPNGQIVEAIGQIDTLCSFGVQSSPLLASIPCVFNVFLKLATPMIMGMIFLEETETMTKYRERMVEIRKPNLQALQVFSINRPGKQLACYVGRQSTLAVPDSGSEVDLMSAHFATARGFQIYPGAEKVEFADGTIAITCGYVQEALEVDNPQDIIDSPIVDFFLLPGLRPNVLVGEDSVEELKIFTKNQHCLVSVSETTGPMELNRIRSLGAVDKIIDWVKKKIRLGRRQSGVQGE